MDMMDQRRDDRSNEPFLQGMESPSDCAMIMAFYRFRNVQMSQPRTKSVEKAIILKHRRLPIHSHPTKRQDFPRGVFNFSRRDVYRS